MDVVRGTRGLLPQSWVCVLSLCGTMVGTLAAGSAVPVAGEPIAARASETNGYGELVRAGELARSSRLFQQAEAGETTLAIKRQVLADRPVLRALSLLRQALGRPTFTPPEAPPGAVFEEFGKFRALARLLRLRQYVLLADGRVTEAIGDARLGLRLSRAVQSETLVSGLVGMAISSLSIRSLGTHLDQLSARDCELLYQVCLEQLQEPSPLPRVLEGERRFAKRSLVEMRASAQGDSSHGRPGAPPDPAPASETKRQRVAAAEAAAAQFAEAEQQVDSYYNRLLVEVAKPPWQRSRVEVSGESVGARLVAPLAQAIDPALNGYARGDAQLRLMACHAAILRYRWEHERLPASLAELNLGELAVDPFTGQTLKYSPSGRTYRLTSAGPPADADDPQAVDGRRPVSVAPD